MLENVINIESDKQFMGRLNIYIVKRNITKTHDESFTANNLAFLLIKSGRFEIKIRENAQDLSAHDLLIIPKNSFCAFTKIEDKFQFFLITFSSLQEFKNEESFATRNLFYLLEGKIPAKISLDKKDYHVLFLIYKLLYSANKFPLRGFIVCPFCDKKLQGSKCKGRHKYYYYYHCEAQCKFRINSEVANKMFIDELKKYEPIPEVKKLYSSILYETHRELADNAGEQKRRLLEQIKDYELRLSKARDLLLSSKIEADDYKLMKEDYNLRITNLERELSSIVKDKHSIESLLVKGVDNLIKLNETYINRNTKDGTNLCLLLL